MKNQTHIIGLIADTHGMLRDSVKDAFRGVSLIIHAGDIDTPDVLDKLKKIAPVAAVRGNMDYMASAKTLPATDMIEFADIFIYVIHDLQKIDLDPPSAGVSVVVFGHSHQSAIYKKDGILYINPGSAGPKKFNRPVSVGLLTIKLGQIFPEIIQLLD